MIHRNCLLCGQPFDTTSNSKIYCGREIERECKLCHTKFKTTCTKGSPEVCSRRCASLSAKLKTFYCANCGEPFHPKSSRQKYCKKPLYKICPICGKEFSYPCSGTVMHACSERCQQLYAVQQSQKSYSKEVRKCEWCGKEFTPVNNTQKYCDKKHYQTCKICGKIFEIHIKATQDIPQTCSDKCRAALSFADGNPFQKPEYREKMRQTMLQRYGVDHPMHNKEVLAHFWDKYKERTGYDHPSHDPKVRSTWFKSSKKNSQFEVRVAELLRQYNIQYIHHYMLNSETASHEFDFYLPDYKILVDCDGVYFHAYEDDPDGHHVVDYYDEDRLTLVPSDHIFHVIVEGQEEKDIKYLSKIIKSMDSGVFDYESDLFKWCRSIEFPYPQYSDKRMYQDFNRLCNYSATKYVPAARLGDSIIQQFHHSIYDARVGNYVSPKEAWYNDDLLKKVILNRLIYKNDVDPFKILKGFNISKICPRVSVFNPILAKHIVNTYLSEFNTIFDPFSGFSGRMLGAAACNKFYIGQDLNTIAVEESNKIIDFLHLETCSVVNKDILQSSGSYECLLTCPPYNTKEHYANELVVKSCDEWIDEILSRFKCKRYAFVVDETEKYKDNVVEEIKSTSHFSRTVEYVVVVDGD